jgi:hypothetical protein
VTIPGLSPRHDHPKTDGEQLLFQEKDRIVQFLTRIAGDLSMAFFGARSRGLKLGESAAGDALQHVLDVTRTLLEAEKCALFLVDLPEKSLVLERASGTVDFKRLKDVATYSLAVPDGPGTGVTPWVLRRKKPFNARNFNELRHNSEGHWKGNWDDPMYGGRDQVASKFQCVYMVPLLAGEKALGVLKYENRTGTKKHFDAADDRR